MTATSKQLISDEIQWHIDNKLTHQIHTSERRAFRACRRRWSWVYQDYLQPQTTPEPLEFGIAFHKAMESFYEPRTWKADHIARAEIAAIAFKQECENQLRQYKKNHPDPDVEVLKSYKERIELGLGMIRYYCKTVSPEYDKNWTPVRVEVGFEIPIKNPYTGLEFYCRCVTCRRKWQHHSGQEVRLNDNNWKGLPVTYGGRLDALFQDEIGRYWIVDWKTTTRIMDADNESAFLQLDDQVASYLWALREMGIECAGFVYVEIKKAQPQEPAILQRPYRGRMVSTSKETLTTYDLALATIQKHDYAQWARGEYNDYLNWLQVEGPKFTQRHQIHKNGNEITAVGETIALEALDMTNDPAVYPQPGRFSCGFCMFRQPCLGMNMGEDYIYTLDTLFDRVSKLYYEEKVPSTE